MDTYDLDFDYTDENEWRKWLTEKVFKLHSKVDLFLKIREHLKEKLSSNEPPDDETVELIRKVLLGGIDENGEYHENSLAKLCKDVFGVYLNPREYINLASLAKLMDLSEWYAIRESYVIKETEFVTFCAEIRETIDKIKSIAHETLEVELPSHNWDEDKIKHYLKNHEDLVCLIQDIICESLDLTMSFEGHTFFIYSLQRCFRVYLEIQYPKLKGKFDKVASMLGLCTYWEPEFVKSSKLRQYLSIIDYASNGLTNEICELNRRILSFIEKFPPYLENLVKIGSRKNLRKEFLREHLSQICEKIKMAPDEYKIARRFLESKCAYWWLGDGEEDTYMTYEEEVHIERPCGYDRYSQLAESTRRSYLYKYAKSPKLKKLFFKKLREKASHENHKDRILRVKDHFLEIIKNLAPFMLVGAVIVERENPHSSYNVEYGYVKYSPEHLRFEFTDLAKDIIGEVCEPQAQEKDS